MPRKIASAPEFFVGQFVYCKLEKAFTVVYGVTRRFTAKRFPVANGGYQNETLDNPYNPRKHRLQSPLLNTQHFRNMDAGHFVPATPEFIKSHFEEQRQVLGNQEVAVVNWEKRVRRAAAARTRYASLRAQKSPSKTAG
jgi:hypothetical protein